MIPFLKVTGGRDGLSSPFSVVTINTIILSILPAFLGLVFRKGVDQYAET